MKILIKMFCYLFILLQGEYRTVFEKVYACQSTNLVQFNVYFNKRTSNITEIKGNFSLSMPLDDSFIVS